MSLRAAVVLLAALGAAVADAQPRTITPTPTGDRRVALVIGNAGYRESPLNNPANDARGVARAARSLGFEVIERIDADNVGMRRAVADFGGRLAAGGIALFYYSGHGLQVNGKNYLVPVDARIASEAYVGAETLDIDSVLGQMDAARSRVNVVVLDACRNNPFARSFRSPQRGLAFMQAPLGTFIAYATSPGDVAADGTPGGYGVFTGELLKVIGAPGLKIEDVFKRVGASVQQRTGRRQTPWVASNLTGDFVFNGTAAAVAAPPAPSPRPDPEPPSTRRTVPAGPVATSSGKLLYPGGNPDLRGTSVLIFYVEPRRETAARVRKRLEDLGAAVTMTRAPATGPAARWQVLYHPAFGSAEAARGVVRVLWDIQEVTLATRSESPDAQLYLWIAN